MSRNGGAGFHSPTQRRSYQQTLAAKKAGDPEAQRLCQAHLDWILDQIVDDGGDVVRIGGRVVPIRPAY